MQYNSFYPLNNDVKHALHAFCELYNIFYELNREDLLIAIENLEKEIITPAKTIYLFQCYYTPPGDFPLAIFKNELEYFYLNDNNDLQKITDPELIAGIIAKMEAKKC